MENTEEQPGSADTRPGGEHPHGGSGRPPLESVEFRCRVHDGPDPDWHVRRLRLTEAISQPYELVVDVMTDAVHTATDELLGADIELDIQRGELRRSVFGVVHRVDYVGVVADKLLVRVFAGPALRLLAHRVDTRIFQDATVLDIVRDVLAPALGAYQRNYEATANKIVDVGKYPKRDYCVQYDESDLDFVSRLLEEEGIAYYFEHDDDARKEKIVLIDSNAGYSDVALAQGPAVPLAAGGRALPDREALRQFEWCRPSQPNKVALRRANWKLAGDRVSPVQTLAAAAEVDVPERGRTSELYIVSGRRKIVDAADDDAFDGSFTEDFEIAGEATRRLELFERDARRGHGRSNVTGFTAGARFELRNHLRSDLAGQRYLLTRVVHTADCPEHDRLSTRSDGERYSNTFECIPDSTPFRPGRSGCRPRVHGPQTAVVIGPPGEEVHVDKFGRIKLRFEWDRQSTADGGSSAWVRVAQTWAGPGWGTMFIPRVGMEVVVEFLDGNPDRPMVIGCVYNAFASPPLELPADKTKSTIKTQSSPTGGGYNELTFEDLAGAEQILVHAQRDLDESIEHCHATRVGADQLNIVGGSQRESVGGDQALAVAGNRSKSVAKNEAIEVAGCRTTTIAGDDALAVLGHTKAVYMAGLAQAVTQVCRLEVAGAHEVDVSGAQKVTVAGASQLQVGETHDAVAAKGYSVAQAAAATMVLKDSKASLWGRAAAAIVAGEAAAAAVVADDTGKLVLSATSELQLICGAASIVLTSDGKIVITGGTEVELRGAAGTVRLDAAGAAIDGPFIRSTAEGNNEITGALVKIN